jgi:hypothetical protein
MTLTRVIQPASPDARSMLRLAAPNTPSRVTNWVSVSFMSLKTCHAAGEATNEVGGSYVIVDTGPWIFGKKVMLPAGVIRDVDLDAQAVFVNRTKDQIKDAPEFDESRYQDEAYRTELGGYYGPGGAGYRENIE